eukprot:2069316-Pleurochrysis_carterae.AAC.1
MQPTAQPTQQSIASCSELQAGVRALQPAQSSARAKAASVVEAESVRIKREAQEETRSCGSRRAE